MTSEPVSARVLIIDDEDTLRRIMERILIHAGHEVSASASARSALEFIKGGAAFDVILCDMMMPDMTGMEFFEKLLSVSPLLARRVIFVSGGATTDQVGAFLGSVANETICKPFGSAQLRDAVQRMLVEQGSGSRAAPARCPK